MLPAGVGSGFTPFATLLDFRTFDLEGQICGMPTQGPYESSRTTTQLHGQQEEWPAPKLRALVLVRSGVSRKGGILAPR